MGTAEDFVNLDSEIGHHMTDINSRLNMHMIRSKAEVASEEAMYTTQLKVRNI